MTKLHTCYPSSESSKPGIDRDSHMISKLKPKIRISHIYAPKIIKTDAANFRELVQRLTGKPEDEGVERSKSKTTPTKDPMDLHSKKIVTFEEEEEEEEEEEDFVDLQNGIRVKNDYKEEELLRRSKSNEKFSGYFHGFSELDGFVKELSAMPM